MSTTLNPNQLRAGSIDNTKLSANAGVLTTQLADGTRLFFADGSVVATAGWNLGGFKITNLATPTAATDAASKQYVDTFLAGLLLKPAIRSLVTGNVTLANPGFSSNDGSTLGVGDRLLLVGQTDQTQNGPYLFNGQAAPLTRAADTLQLGSLYIVDEGTTNQGVAYVLTEPATFTGAIVVGTTTLPFSKLGAATALSAGNGVNIASNVVTIIAAPSQGLQVTAQGIGILLATGSGLSLGTGGLTVDTTVVPKFGNFVASETPTGAVNGTNSVFTLARSIVGGAGGFLFVTVNGQVLSPGASSDYQITSANTITFNAGSIPNVYSGVTDIVRCYYLGV